MNIIGNIPQRKLRYKNYLLKDIYGLLDEEVKEKITCKQYVYFVKDVFAMFVKRLLQGKRITFGRGLGSLEIVRKKRQPYSKKIDFGETAKLRKKSTEEEIKQKKHVVYRTNDYWFGYKWSKGVACTCYRFKPVYGNARAIPKNKETLEYVVR